MSTNKLKEGGNNRNETNEGRGRMSIQSTCPTTRAKVKRFLEGLKLFFQENEDTSFGNSQRRLGGVWVSKGIQDIF